MKFCVIKVYGGIESQSHILINRENDEFTSFPADIDNPNYYAFLESQGLTDEEVQAMEPDVWHDIES